MIVIEEKNEIEKYYEEDTDTYVFDDDVTFGCNVFVSGNIHAIGDIETTGVIGCMGNIFGNNIQAKEIITGLIRARTITTDRLMARTIKANDIYIGNAKISGYINDLKIFENTNNQKGVNENGK